MNYEQNLRYWTGSSVCTEYS